MVAQACCSLSAGSCSYLALEKPHLLHLARRVNVKGYHYSMDGWRLVPHEETREEPSTFAKVYARTELIITALAWAVDDDPMNASSQAS